MKRRESGGKVVSGEEHMAIDKCQPNRSRLRTATPGVWNRTLHNSHCVLSTHRHTCLTLSHYTLYLPTGRLIRVQLPDVEEGSCFVHLYVADGAELAGLQVTHDARATDCTRKTRDVSHSNSTKMAKQQARPIRSQRLYGINTPKGNNLLAHAHGSRRLEPHTVLPNPSLLTAL